MPHEFRTIADDVVGDIDIFKSNPWRSPGTSPVFGSGCGTASGGKKYIQNTDHAPTGFRQGQDGLTLPPKKPEIWKTGSIVEVAWGISANHGGGYSYRLCKNDGKNDINEECFQKTPLNFADNQSSII